MTEQPGRVRILQNGILLAQPALTLTDVFTTGENGVLGLALHPSFASNHLLYLVYTAAGPDAVITIATVSGSSSRSRFGGQKLLQHTRVPVLTEVLSGVEEGCAG